MNYKTFDKFFKIYIFSNETSILVVKNGIDSKENFLHSIRLSFDYLTKILVQVLLEKSQYFPYQNNWTNMIKINFPLELCRNT